MANPGPLDRPEVFDVLWSLKEALPEGKRKKDKAIAEAAQDDLDRIIQYITNLEHVMDEIQSLPDSVFTPVPKPWQMFQTRLKEQGRTQ